jgi:2,4-dienoyl-CoA reductase-like NADH-dependent reductase (Old Yellow Enzyme family)
MPSNNSLNIKGIELKSKFFFAPVNTGLALDGNPTEELIRFHRLRSNEYTGISYVGNVAIDIENVTNKNTLFINSTMKNYSELASEIKKGGSVPGIQIACFKSGFEAQRSWKNSTPNDYTEFIRKEVGRLTLHQIKQVVKSFQSGIKKLAELGFEAIQIHGAHGYFINNFLSHTFNSRTDEYGNDRTLIVKEILDGIDSVVKSSIIDLRISLFEKSFKDKLSEGHFSFLENINRITSLDVISITNGIYNIDKKVIYPVRSKGFAFMLEILIDFIQTHREKIWNICGNVRNVSELINQNNQVTFSVGRSIIADHDFLKKHFEKREQEIVECAYKNECHYFSLKKDFIECGVNKKLY